MNTKITVGVIVGIGIIVLAFAYSSNENKISEDFESNVLIPDNNEAVLDNNEGKQFSISLSDNVVASGP